MAAVAGRGGGGGGETSWKAWAARKVLRGRFFTEDYNKVFLLCFALSCKGLEWWYSRGEAAAKAAIAVKGKAIPPPLPPEPSQDDEAMKLPKSPKLCPICRRVKQEPAVLTSTGYVFCYACIMLHVKAHGKCPVTLTPASEVHVRKLYFT